MGEKTPTYSVIHFRPDNPTQLADWLNKICAMERWELVACAGEYFIFKHSESDDE